MGGGLTADEMVEFLCSKLEGDARREIACRGVRPISLLPACLPR